MQFLKILFWAVVMAMAVLFSYVNWEVIRPPIKIWADFVVDVKIPVLVLISFLLGFLPTFVTLRLQIRSLKRRLDTQNLSNAGPAVVSNPVPAPVRRSTAPGESALAERDVADREATDSKAWPSA